VVVAIVGAVIAYFQWRTAQQKVVLELYEARYRIYDDLRAAVSQFLIKGELSQETDRAFLDAQSRARFRFGEEVDQYLKDIRHDLIAGSLFARYDAGNIRGLDDHLARLDRLNAFYAEIDRMFVPYMRLDQRMPTWWWPNFRHKLKPLSKGKRQ
jgi:hypothetical protein